MISTLRRQDLIEPELSYRITGVFFRVFNELGPGLREMNYERAIAEALRQEKIAFKEQHPIGLQFGNKNIGRYFVDFIIGDKIIVELKRGHRVNRLHAQQILSYLKALNLPLGILVYFGADGVTFKRVLNKPNPDS